MEWEDYQKKCVEGKDDKPDKYGFTERMHKITDLVEDEKSLESGGFKITDADREFYEETKAEYEWHKKQRGGKPFKFQRYIVDIDPW